jgi:iron complex transport system ATP-binding protein
VTAIVVDSLAVDLGRSRVLDGIDATIAPGEWIALIGPNGAGKSTLLRAVAGLFRYAGSVTIDGDEVSRLPRRTMAQRLAFVPQAPLLPPGMRVGEYVLLGRTAHLGPFGGESAHDLETAGRALTRLDLGELADRRLSTLSGGEQQRAVLCRALVQEAPLLLLDEPTTSLDIGRQQQALELVAALREQSELTVVCAMHDITLAAQYAERLLVLSGGRLVAVGTPAEIASAELIAEHYGAQVRIVGEGGSLAVIPVRRQ